MNPFQPKANGERGSILSDQSPIQLGIVILLCGAIWAGSTWASDVTHAIDALSDQIHHGTKDRWTGGNMKVWVDQANREVELWSIQAEHNLGLEDGEFDRLEFPDPDAVRRDQ